MKKMVIFTLCILCFITFIQAEQTNSRIIHFPKDDAVGRLMIRDIDPNQRSIYMRGWELLSQAQGDVTVPANKQLRFELYEDLTDISFLSELKPEDLESLSLRRTDVVDEEFVYMKKLTGLQELDLSSMQQIDGSGLAHLANFKSLKDLTCFNSNVSDIALEHISKIASLERLTLYVTQIDGSGLIHLKNLTSLTELSLSQTLITDNSLVHIKDMTWLKQLELYDTQIGDDGLAYLKELTSLERLILGNLDRDSDVNSPITDAGLIHLSKLTKLKNLGLYRTCITDEGLKHLSGLTNLESLSLDKTKITGAGFAYLNKLAPLRALELDNTDVTGVGLANLKPWSNTFENLIIDGTNINDADLAYLTDFKNLKYINLTSTSITDAGLEHLRNIKSLETLYFTNTKITDKGLMLLKELPNLKTVNVNNTLVTNVGLETFKQESASKSFETNKYMIVVSSREGGARVRQLTNPQPEAKPISLISKPIPGLEKIKINMDFEQTKGKEILFCFFDIEQRPSRNCMMQLNKKARELKSKDIEIVSIHTSKNEQEKLNDWVEENEIEFPVGVIENETEQTCLNWGVKSLPWLILTDKEHIVTAEGFSINELDEEIKEQ